jgi:hypothetical protein
VSKVHVLSAAPDNASTPHARSELEAIQLLAGRDRFGVHELVDSPQEADLILFVEHSTDAGAYFQDVRKHPVYKRFGPRCYLFSSTDRVIPFLPGVYAAIERSWYRSSWVRSGPYLRIGANQPAAGAAEAGNGRYLFSFVGTPHSAPVRPQIVALQHPRALIRDTSAANDNSLSAAEYAATVRDSAFVLCPRGGGTSSFRLFETMMLGRVPVIISDEWTPPTGPDWPSFSVRVAEVDVGQIPALLERLEPQASAMGGRARQAWDEWFAPDVLFHRVVEWCLAIEADAGARGPLMPLFPYVQLLRPYHTLRWIARNLGHGSWRVPRWLYKLLRVPTA